MLTQEQIKKLNINDKLLVQGEFIKAHDNGSILVSLSTKAWESTMHELLFFPPSCLSLPSEIVNSQSSIVNKYAPPRLFKKGDEVTPRIYLGRKDKGLEMGEKYIVTADEIAGDMVAIKHHFTLRPDIVQTCFLELVTPVEELEPYKLIDSPNTYNIVRDSAMVMTIHKKSHPNAKAAAEAERDRLNAEWRKEQK